MKALIVEQEAVLNQSLSVFLEKYKKYEVLSAGSQRDAFSIFFKAAPFDLVLCGDPLPDGSGLEMLKTLIKANPGVVSVLMTVHGDEVMEKEALLSGISGYLVKPFDLKQLEAAICKHNLVQVKTNKEVKER